MNELTIIGLLITALGIGLFVASVRAARKMDPHVPDLPRIEVRDDLKNLPAGSVVTVSYDALLNKEQRAALKQAIEYQVGQGVKVIVLEGGIKIISGPAPDHMKTGHFYDPYNRGEPAREALIAALQAGKISDKEAVQYIAEGKLSINDVSMAQARRRDDTRAPGEVSQWEDQP